MSPEPSCPNIGAISLWPAVHTQGVVGPRLKVPLTPQVPQQHHRPVLQSQPAPVVQGSGEPKGTQQKPEHGANYGGVVQCRVELSHLIPFDCKAAVQHDLWNGNGTEVSEGSSPLGSPPPGVLGVTYLHLPIVLAGYAVGLIRQHHQPALVILDKGLLHHGVVILFGTWALLG